MQVSCLFSLFPLFCLSSSVLTIFDLSFDFWLSFRPVNHFVHRYRPIILSHRLGFEPRPKKDHQIRKPALYPLSHTRTAESRKLKILIERQIRRGYCLIITVPVPTLPVPLGGPSALCFPTSEFHPTSAPRRAFGPILWLSSSNPDPNWKDRITDWK